MTAERMEAMRDICYSYEVRTKVRGMKCVLVIEKTALSVSVSRMTRRMELLYICMTRNRELYGSL